MGLPVRASLASLHCVLEQDPLLVQPRKTHPDITEKLLLWDIKNQIKQNPQLLGGITPNFIGIILGWSSGDKNSTRTLVITSDILKGRVILPKLLSCRTSAFGRITRPS